jgi:hypothetical protein
MAYPNLNPQEINGANVQVISEDPSYHRLYLPAGKAGQYRLAQLDDHAKSARRHFPHRPPIRLTLMGRTSAKTIPGTWGFGFWNYPFGVSLGFSVDGFRLPALPNAVWFFNASKENYLSFQEPPPTSPENNAANGLLAQVFRSPHFDLRLIPAALAFPFSHSTTRRLLGKVIREDGVQLRRPAADRHNQESVSPPHQVDIPARHRVDPTQWHRYQIDWHEGRVSFQVDDIVALETPVSPHPPLGLVIWIDNQYAAFTPEGKIGFGVLANPEPAWLEVKEIEVTQG